MTRITVALEHKKFFQLNGFIAFEELASSDEMRAIFEAIQKRRGELPGLTQENLFRSLSSVHTLARKLGSIAAALLDRKPVRLAYDCFIEELNIPEIQEREIGLLLSKSGKGLFFTDHSQLYKEKEACYLLLVFTANYVNNPVVFQ